MTFHLARMKMMRNENGNSANIMITIINVTVQLPYLASANNSQM